MKKIFALLLTLGLLAGLLAVPASAAPALDAYEACQLLDSCSLASKVDGASRRGKFFVDFDQNGIPEMVVVYGAQQSNGCVLVYYITDSGTVAQATGFRAGVGSGDGINIYTMWSNYTDGKLIQFKNGTYGLRVSDSFGGSADNTSYQYTGNGAFKKTSSKGTELWTFTVTGYKTNVTVPDKYAYFAQPVEPVAPPKPEVPASPLGDRLPAAKAEAIAQLDGIYYSGDRAAIAMTRAQARAIQAQIAQYAAAAPTVNHPGMSRGHVYVSLFDAGCGVPGVFMAKGYGLLGRDGPMSSGGGEVLFDVGECAIWTFQGEEALVPFPHLTAEDNVSIYPCCVERSTYAGDESHCETNYYAMGYGTLFSNPGSTLVEDRNWDTGAHTCYVNGARVTEKQYREFVTLWQGAGLRATAGPGGGVEYIIKYMTPADQAAAALENFVNAFTAYPATQAVELDGVAVELQCYALKDAAGSPTNYVKLRDLAMLLSGTDAQFDVGWDASVAVTSGKAYTPNGTELTTPFSGERTYSDAAAPTKVNGQDAQLSAFVLTDDQGGGYTYYKLRDLGAALGFTVDWSADRGVFIETR